MGVGEDTIDGADLNADWKPEAVEAADSVNAVLVGRKTLPVSANLATERASRIERSIAGHGHMLLQMGRWQ